MTQMRGLVQKAVDFSERVFLILLAIPFLWAFARVLLTHPYLLLTAASEMLGVVLIVTRKPGEVGLRGWPILIAFAGTALPLLARPGGTQLAPSVAGWTLMFAGLALSVASKVFLNRSFGLVAANRGVKIGGPYHLVRHPMYLGYIVNEAGFLLLNFKPLNLLCYAAAWTFQILRVREEESILNRDPAYRNFASRVRTRLLPGVF